MPGILDPLWDPLSALFPCEVDHGEHDDDEAHDVPTRAATGKKGIVARHVRERERLERRRDNQRDERRVGEDCDAIPDIENWSTWEPDDGDDDDSDDDMTHDGDGSINRLIDQGIEKAAQIIATAQAEAAAVVSAADRKAERMRLETEGIEIDKLIIEEKGPKSSPIKDIAPQQSLALEENNAIDDFIAAAGSAALIVEESPDGVPAILLPTRTRSLCGTEAIFIDKQKLNNEDDDEEESDEECEKKEDISNEDTAKEGTSKDGDDAEDDDETIDTSPLDVTQDSASLDIIQDSASEGAEAKEEVTAPKVDPSPSRAHNGKGLSLGEYKALLVAEMEGEEDDDDDHNHIVLLQESDGDGGIEAHHIFTEKKCVPGKEGRPALDSVGSF